MEAPDIFKYVREREAREEVWVQQNVKPYLQHLLNRIGTRCYRHKVIFRQGMGAEYIDFEPANSKSKYYMHGSDIPKRIATRFPELIEFWGIVEQLDGQLNYCIGDMESLHASVP